MHEKEAETAEWKMPGNEGEQKEMEDRYAEDIFNKKLSVIVPAYNEGKTIYHNLLEMEKLIGSFCTDFELIVVDDGSLDDTKEQIRRAAEETDNITAAGYVQNRGKGAAVKEGTAYASGDYIAFLDADLDLSPMHLRAFLKKMSQTGACAVIGSKMHKDSQVEYPLPRKIMSLGYYVMLKVLFRLNIKDTQTGIKLFEARALNQVIQDVGTDGFAYDIEVLALLRRCGGKIEEMPVRLVFKRESRWGRIKMSDILMVARDTLRIYRNVHKLKRMGKKLESIKPKSEYI